jgi:hypothetical protein
MRIKFCLSLCDSTPPSKISPWDRKKKPSLGQLVPRTSSIRRHTDAITAVSLRITNVNVQTSRISMI